MSNTQKKGVKRQAKTNNENNFWVYSALQNKVIEKIIFRKLQDTESVSHVGVPATNLIKFLTVLFVKRSNIST